MLQILHRLLPGPPRLRGLLIAVLMIALILACFRWGFPAFDSLLPSGSVHAPDAAIGPASTW